MFVKLILMINYLLLFHLVFGFNGIGGWHLPSFFGGVEDPPVEKSFLLPMDDDYSLGTCIMLLQKLQNYKITKLNLGKNINYIKFF
jgi:hypothetical protein